ncbi:MAG: hypothetical protein NTZ49_03740 [Candidatus Parcubacteria bacterium]|nr:hypothetical protein [Candidatus Parcubacteria bacterium]
MTQISWPIRLPKLIADLHLKSEVARLVRKANLDTVQADNFAEKIFQKYLRDKNFKEALQIFLDLAISIDIAKKLTIGPNGSTRNSNFIIQIIAAYFARRISYTEQDLTYLKAFSAQLESLETEENWFFAKTLVLQEYMERIIGARLYIKGLKILNPQLFMELSAKALPDLAQDLEATMKELTILKRYGIKTSFFQDGVLHGINEVWVFTDYRDIIAATSFKILEGKPLALVSLATIAAMKNPLSLKVREVVTSDSKVTLAGYELEGFLSWSMDEKAEFDASSGLGLLPVREIFSQAQKSDIYEIFRLTQVMRLYDLIVPLTVVEQMPKLPRVESSTLKNIVNRFRTAARPLNPDLLVPRIRTMENPRHLIEELEKEVEIAEQETKKRTHCHHEVIDFIRRLPQGYKPSARARALAKEHLGIELADNETYVKKHERGKGSSNAGVHQAKHRE